MRNHLLLRFLFVPFLILACDDDSSGPPAKPEPLAFSTFQTADVVIGQYDMLDGRDDAGTGVIGPAGVANVVGAPSWGDPLGPLYLVDQGHNRVLGYKFFPTSNGRAANFVLGQDDFVTDDYGESASKFTIPNRCHASHGRLFLSDYGNERVLLWNSLPTANRPADVVVGQEDFESSVLTLDASHIAEPAGVMEAGGKLFVADPARYRLLIYNRVPSENGAPADVVVGQSDFTTAGYSVDQTHVEPIGFWTDGERLVLCDGGSDRVLIWNRVPTANGAPADIVVGAPDFNTSGSNTPSATSIGQPWGVASDGNLLFVADYAFNRVLVYDPFPTASNPAASYVLGQSTFSNSTANDDDQDGVTESFPTGRTLYQPADVSVIGRRLLVADQGNNRVLVFESR